jgi:hypothetical protein
MKLNGIADYNNELVSAARYRQPCSLKPEKERVRSKIRSR